MSMLDGESCVFRADADAQIGAGHAVRTLSLACAWRDAGGEPVFATTGLTPFVLDALKDERIPVEYLDDPRGSRADAEGVVAVADAYNANWITADDYSFRGDYYAALTAGSRIAGARRVLAFDDYGHADRYPVDVLLNVNPFADPQAYRARGFDAAILTGSAFALLRPSYRRYQDWQRVYRPIVERVLVTLGGGDALETVGTVLAGLSACGGNGLEVVTVIPHGANGAELPKTPGLKNTVLPGCSDLAELMATADLAISGAGGTCWELAFMQTPMVLVTIADNQAGNVEYLVGHDIALSVGDAAAVTPDKIKNAFSVLESDFSRRRSMAMAGRRLIDGCGAERVVAAMREMM